MQSRPLTIAHIFERAEAMFAHKRIVSAREEMRYDEWVGRVRQLVTVLDALEVPRGARVATLAANHHRHLEVYAAVPVSKRVLHTVNFRLSADDLEYVVDHAGDDVVFIDREQLSLVRECADRLTGVRHWIVFPRDSAGGDGAGVHGGLPDDPRFLDYEELLAGAEPAEGSFEAAFTSAEENLAAGLCYTSGTTGRPKGVLYSHRSTVLHCLGAMSAGFIGLNERDVVLPIVPMFHANAWGLPYGALMAGADLVLPGRSTDPEHLLDLMERQRVTVAGAVPTVWTSLLPHIGRGDLSALRLPLGGGSMVSPVLSAAYESTIGVPITNSWGMTEVSPIGAVGGLRSHNDDDGYDAKVAAQAAQGQPLPLVTLRTVDVDSGKECLRDGKSVGELQVAGPWVAKSYYRDVSPATFTDDGWLCSGDLATIDRFGYVRLVDRIKDLIKSGGEWISSVELESAIGSHPDVVEVAVVAREDPLWAERPVACVVLRSGAGVSADQLREHITPLVAKWWIPDEFNFFDSMPKTGTGKLSKVALRESLNSTSR